MKRIYLLKIFPIFRHLNHRLFKVLFRGDYEHMCHLVDDLIRLELENQALRDLYKPILIPSVWKTEIKVPDYELTTNASSESITHFINVS